MKKRYLLPAVMGFSLMGLVGSASAASFADVAFVVDQSGSMNFEFSWIGSSISDIDTAIAAGGVTAKYGVAGYERLAGFADTRNAWVDLTSDVSAVVAKVNAVKTYGGTENGYQALDWAADNFSWTGGGYAKVMVLITDEPNNNRDSYAYGGSTGENALAKKMADDKILLNVITQTGFWQYWDGAAYSTSDGYQGLFDLDYLRTNPADFTSAFVAAKLKEIQEFPTDPTNPIPEPGTLLLMGVGLAGLASVRRKKA